MKRRKFLQDAGATALIASLPLGISAQESDARVPSRSIPSTGEQWPILGFGSSTTFSGDDFESAAALLDALRDAGGKFIGTWGPAQTAPAGACHGLSDCRNLANSCVLSL